MAKTFRKLTATAVIAALLGQAAAVSAATPSGLSDLVGARAASGEEALESRGYTSTHVANRDGGKIVHWWNGSKRECVSVTTYDGRFESINGAHASDCGQRGSSGDKTAAAVVGAAALLGIVALASKSHHRDGYDYDTNSTAQHERGYRDGLYGQSYHNYDRSDAYSRGYEQGTRERGYETPYRPGYYQGGGYGGYAYMNDLVGRSRNDATAVLRQRGFVLRDPDNTDYDGRYTTWWRGESRQCITVNSRDGYIRSVQSVGDRNCR